MATNGNSDKNSRFVTWSRMSAIVAPLFFAVAMWMGGNLYSNIIDKLDTLSLVNQSILSRQTDFALDIVQLQTQMLERTGDRITATQAAAIQANTDARIAELQDQVEDIRDDIDTILQGSL